MWKLAAWVSALILAAGTLAGFGYACFHWGVSNERLAWTTKEAGVKLAATKKAAQTAQSQAVEQQRSYDAIEVARAAGRADALRHVAGLRQSPDIHIDLPAFAGAAEAVAGAGQTAELDDAVTCSDAVTGAEGWQRWWQRVSTSPADSAP